MAEKKTRKLQRAFLNIVVCLFGLAMVLGRTTPAFPYAHLVGSVDRPDDAYDIDVADGYVYTAEDLVQIIDVSNPTAPEIVKSINTPGTAYGVAVVDSLLYVACGSNGLNIYDISNPLSPQFLGKTDGDGGWDVAVLGDYAYTADRYNGLKIIDVSDPSAPYRVGLRDTPSDAWGVSVEGSYAYVADSNSGIQVVNVSDPTDPQIIKNVPVPGNPRKVTAVGGYVYVPAQNEGVYVIDARNPATAHILTHIDVPGTAADIAVAETLAYIAHSDGYVGGLQIMDTSNPSSPVLMGTVDAPVWARGVAVLDDYAYVTDRTNFWTDDRLVIIDVRDPKTPKSIGDLGSLGFAREIETSGDYAYIGSGSTVYFVDVSVPMTPHIEHEEYTVGTASGLDLVGHYLYVSDNADYLHIINVIDPTNPIVRTYNVPSDSWDITVAKGYAYISGLGSDSLIVDVRDPEAPPQVVGTFHLPGYTTHMVVKGNYAYAVTGFLGADALYIVDITDRDNPVILENNIPMNDEGTVAIVGDYVYFAEPNNLYVIDIEDPYNPQIVNSVSGMDYAHNITIEGRYAYVPGDGLTILDITDPFEPFFVDSVPLPTGAWDVAIVDRYAYVADDNEGGLQIVDLYLGEESREAAPVVLGDSTSLVTAYNSWSDYYVDVPAGSNAVFQLTGDWAVSPTYYFYMKEAEMPTRSSFGARLYEPNRGNDYEFLIPTSAYNRRIYLSAYNQLGAEIEGIITTEGVDRYVSEINLSEAGNTNWVTFTVSGLGFLSAGMDAELRLGASTLESSQVIFMGPTELSLTFDLDGALPGLYDLYLIWPDADELGLPSAFEVKSEGTGPILESSLHVPSAVRPGRRFALYVYYGNEGDGDMVAPVFVIESPDALPMSLSRDGPYEDRPVQILGVNPSGYAGVLSPGSHSVIPIYFQVPPDAFGHQEFGFTLSVLSRAGDPIDWDEVETQVKPLDANSEVWDRLWPLLTAQIGSTWRDYQQALAADAGYLSTLGRRIYSARDLFGYEFRKVLGMNPHTYLSGSLDAYCPAPGIPLVFGRVFPNGLDKRLYSGAFGRGWTHSYDMHLRELSDGDILLHGPSGFSRLFQKENGGSYTASPGDYGTLSKDGSIFFLTEKDGTAFRFREDLKIDSIEDLNANRITAVYNASGLLVAASHTCGASFELEYDGDRIIQLTDHAGRVTAYGYDASGEHLVAATAPGGRVTTYGYHAETEGPPDHVLLSIESPNGTHKYYEYDALGRLQTEYLDNYAEQLSYTYDDFGAITAADAEGRKVDVLPDELGRLGEVRDDLGRSVRLTHGDGVHLSQVIDPSWGAYDLAWDHRGNVTDLEDPLDQNVGLTYDYRFSALSSLVDQRGNTSTFSYDDAGNLLSIAYPDLSSETFEYDAAGNIASVTNRRGDDIRLTYNERGQVTQKDYSDGSSVIYTYDDDGRLDEVTDASGTIDLTYYEGSGVLQRIEYPAGHWFEFEYNDAGQRTRRTGDDGYILNYEYDDAARLARLVDGASNELIRYEYDASGRLSAEYKGNGTYTTYVYDAAGQLLSLANYGPAGATQSFFAYTYDDNGNRTSMTTLDGTTAYTYDAIGQLIGVSYPGGREVSYEYDAAGNRVTVTDDGATTSYTTNNMNQYTEVGDATYAYDADGNMISKTDPSGTTFYEYDYENRLARVVTPASGTWKYTYDPLGNRISVNLDGELTKYVHDPIGLVDVAMEYSSSGALVARYVHGLGLISRIDAGHNSAYYSYDAIGHTRQITNAAGVVVNAYDYAPFGGVLQSEEMISNPFQYVGRFGVMAERNSLKFMRARYYDAWIGGFLSQDPINIMDEINLYTYVGNNPILYIDPSGLLRIGQALQGGLQIIGGTLSIVTSLIATGSTLGAVAPAAIPAMLLGGYSIGAGARNVWNAFMPNDESVFIAGNPFESAGSYGYVKTGNKNWKRIGQIGGLIASFSTGRMAGASPWKKGVDWFMDSPSIVTTGKTTAEAIGDVLASGPIPSVTESDLISSATAENIIPMDPNEKAGPIGVSAEGFIASDELLTYTVYFENLETASAPAQEVFITDYLHRDLDWTTFSFNDFSFGDQVISAPEGADQYSDQITTRVVFATTETLYVEIEAALDPVDGKVSWRFTSLDPETGDYPEDPLVGFLPPEDGTGRGQGHVSFTIRPKSTCTPGTRIANYARIVFDTNPPMDTNIVYNTIADLPVDAPAWPVPNNGSDDIPVSTVLNWGDAPHAASYDLYFWPAAEPAPSTATTTGLTSSHYVPASLPLEYETTYYWQVVASNISSEATGPKWSFSTQILSTPTPTSTSTFTATCTATETATCTRTPTSTPTNAPPEVVLQYAPIEGSPPLEVALIGSATDTDGFLVQFGWAFEDAGIFDATASIASATVENTTSYAYNTSGIYQAGFWVWDDGGEARCASHEIRVWTPIPTVTDTPTPTETPTFTPPPTFTPTALPTDTATPMPTPTDTPIDTPRPEPTVTPAFVLSLGPGYNPVGPALDLAYLAQDMCDDISGDGCAPSEIIRYMREAGVWEIHICGLPFNNFPIENGKGYFVKSSDSCDWLQEAPLIPTPLAIQLGAGYNPVCLPSWWAGASVAAELCQEINGQSGSVTEVIRYVRDTGAWETHICGLPFNNFPIAPGVTYILKCSEESEWVMLHP